LLDFDDTVTDFEQGDVERSATEVEDEDGLVLTLVEAVCERRCGGLVDDAADVEARDFAGFLGSLTLVIVEVGRDRDDGVGHFFTEVSLSVALEFLKNERADLLRVEGLVVDLDRPVGSHVALDRADRAINVRDALALGDFSGQDFAVFSECDNRRRRTGTFSVCDNGGFATF
jgi:hypothetical protein